MEQRKIYSSLDVVKFVMALLILTQHTSSEWAHTTGLVHAFFGLGNFAVPFFFACSGFLFFTKLNSLQDSEQSSYYKKWSIRLGKMYLVWSLIYFCFVFIGWINKGLSWSQPLHYIHGALVLSTYATIWFLPALWIGVSVCYMLKNMVPFKMLALINCFLLLIGGLFGSYTSFISNIPFLSNFNDWYIGVFYSWRNGLFNASPYVFIGILLSEGYLKKLSLRKNILLTTVFSLCFLIEAYLISYKHLSTATDQGIMLAPSIFFMLNTLTKINLNRNDLWIHLRNWSMLVFLGQRLFLSAIPGVFPSMRYWISSLSQFEIFIFFIVVVLGFAIIIEQLSQKVKILKILW